MIQLNKIDHVCLWVRSLAESRVYYETLFGLSCRQREGDPTTLLVESNSVHFFLAEAGPDTDFTDKQHLSFEVDSLATVIETLEQMGISDYSTGQVNFFETRNYKWCEWRDPSGIRLECVEVI